MNRIPKDSREYRRFRALELHEQGWLGKDIAAALGVTNGAVSQWLSRAELEGREALHGKKHPGAAPKLSAEQFSSLITLLEAGPEAHGFRGNVWTCPRVVELIRQAFGVSYHPAHMSRILKRLGWSPRKPVRRATQRDEAAIEVWREEVWTAAKKRAEQESRTVVFVDESAFYLLPGVVRSYAPRGATPVLHAPLSREHLSVIGGITLEGGIFQHVLDLAARGGDLVVFLRHLVRHLGRILAIWDGLPAHRSKIVKEYLHEAHGQVWLERLPAYAPDLNPEEGSWQHLKIHELATLCCQTVTELKAGFLRASERLRHKTNVIRGCFGLAGLI